VSLCGDEKHRNGVTENSKTASMMIVSRDQRYHSSSIIIGVVKSGNEIAHGARIVETAWQSYYKGC
jgi:hypothetical protein